MWHKILKCLVVNGLIKQFYFHQTQAVCCFAVWHLQEKKKKPIPS